MEAIGSSRATSGHDLSQNGYRVLLLLVGCWLLVVGVCWCVLVCVAVVVVAVVAVLMNL